MNYAEREIERIESNSRIIEWISPLNKKMIFKIPHTVYPPREDTDLLAETIFNLGQGRNKKLLEIGCGSGVISIFANDFGWDVVGCDINPLAVATSKGIAKSNRNHKLEFIEGGIEPHSEMNANIFDKGPFDLIVWNLPYLRKPKKEEFLGPFEEAALSDLGDVNDLKLHQLLLNKIDKFQYLKKDGVIILIHNDENGGKLLTSECRKMGWATREINHKYLENGEKIISSAIWKPWNHAKIITLDSIDSTNSFLLNGDFPIGTLVTANNQTDGRGQRENKWIHFEGGWVGSWKIPFKNTTPALIQAKAALAVLDTIGALKSIPLPTFDLVSMSTLSKYEISIKWPNDLLIQNRKFSGILCEARTQGEVTNFVVGIGCNLSDDFGEIESRNEYNASSLKSLEINNQTEWMKVLNASISSQFENHNLVGFLDDSDTIINWWQSMFDHITNHVISLNDKKYRINALKDNGTLELISLDYDLKSITTLEDSINCNWVKLDLNN